MDRGENRLASLVNARIQALGISKAELVKRCGFRNISKGLRRLEKVCAGDIDSAQFLLINLAAALSLDAALVNGAIAATKRDRWREEDRRYRDSFRPHAIIQTDRPRPEPLFVAMLLGFESTLRINFAAATSPITFAGQAKAEIHRRLGERKGFPAFGRPIGFVVNYNPDTAISFSLDGVPREIFERAIRLAEGRLELRGKLVPFVEPSRLRD